MLKIGKTQPSVVPSRETNFDPWPMSIFTDYRIVSNYIELCTCKAIPDFTQESDFSHKKGLRSDVCWFMSPHLATVPYIYSQAFREL